MARVICEDEHSFVAGRGRLFPVMLVDCCHYLGHDLNSLHGGIEGKLRASCCDMISWSLYYDLRIV